MYMLYFGALFRKDTVYISLKNFPVQVWFVSCGNGVQHSKPFYIDHEHSCVFPYFILFYIPVHPHCLFWPAELHISHSILDSLPMYSRGFLYGNSNSWSHFESSFEGRMYTGPLWWRIAQISWIKQTNKKHYTSDSRFSKTETAYHSQWTDSIYSLKSCFYEWLSPVCCSSVDPVSPALRSLAPALACLPVTAGWRLSLFGSEISSG